MKLKFIFFVSLQLISTFIIMSCQFGNATMSVDFPTSPRFATTPEDTDIGIWYATWYSKVDNINTTWKTGFGSNSEAQFVADCDGDGYEDAIVYEGSSGVWSVALSDSSSFGTVSSWIIGHGVGSTTQMMGDVDGDGQSDAIAYFASGNDWYVSLSNGSGFDNYSQWISGHGISSSQLFLADVDGDGKDDAVTFSNGNWEVAISSGSGFGTPSQWISGYGSGSASQLINDINRDSKADAVTFLANGTWNAAYSTGTGFSAPFQWISGHGSGSSTQLLADGDGYGLADAYVFFNPIGDFYGDWYVVKSYEDIDGSFGVNPYSMYNNNFGGGSTKQFVGNVANCGDTGWKENVTFTVSTGTWEVQRYRDTKGNLYDLWDDWNIPYVPYVDGSYAQYDSGDIAVIDAHLQSLADLEIDFIIMDETNNLYVDDGFIFTRAKKVGERIRVWNSDPSNRTIKYVIAIGGIQWSHNPRTIEYEAGEVWDEFFNSPTGGQDNYYYLDGKPLLINYCIPNDKSLWVNYSGDKSNSDPFTMRWAHSPAESGTYGWETRSGTIEDEEVMVVMPGWNNNKGATPVSRANGDYYALSSWNKVLEASANPEIIVINSWNEHAEETSIEPTSTANCSGDSEKWYNKSGLVDNFMYLDMTERYIDIYKNRSYQASDLFSGGYGWYLWLYEELSGSTFSDLTWDSNKGRWVGSSTYTFCGSNWQHPDNTDTVRSWIAPISGTVTIAGTVKKSDSNGDGIKASILKNSITQWGLYTITNTTGIAHSINVSVAKGDIIRFVVNNNSTSSYDTTLWDPVISY